MHKNGTAGINGIIRKNELQKVFSQMICMSGGEDGNGRPAQARSNSSWFDDEVVETNDEFHGYSCW